MKTMEIRMKEAAEKKNNYKVYHFKDWSTPHLILYPLMIICWIYNVSVQKLINKVHSCYKWNEKRAYRIITEELIRRGGINSSDGTIYYDWRRWGNWWFDKYHCKLRDRMFCKKFNEQITDYFRDKYEIVGYVKEVDTSDNEWYSFTFRKED